MRKNTLKIFAYLLLPVLVIGGAVLLRDELRELAGFFPACAFNQITGELCPACGNTRSVLALLRGDVLASLRYNITPVVIGILLLLLYIERLSAAFGKNIRLLPRKTAFWVVFLVGMLLYYFLRNFM